MDVEWQPTFGAQPVRAALLQIALDDQVFLVDLFTLREIEKLEAAQGRALVEGLFSNPRVLKLGFSMKEDLQAISRSLPGLEHLPQSIKNWTDLHTTCGTILSRQPSFFPTQSMCRIFVK